MAFPGQYATPRRVTGPLASYFQISVPSSGVSAKTVEPPVRYITPSITSGVPWRFSARVSKLQACRSVATFFVVICVNGENLITNRGGQSGRLHQVRRCSHNQAHESVRILLIREVHFRLWVCVQTLVLNITDDSDDLVPDLRRRGLKAETFAHRFLAGPEPARECFIDDYNSRRVFPVSRCEFASPMHGNPHRLEVRGSDCAFTDLRAICNGKGRTAFNDEARRRVAIAQRKGINASGARYSGHRSDAFE